MILADLYMIGRLKFLCEEKICKMVNLNNVIDLLLLLMLKCNILIKLNKNKDLRPSCSKYNDENPKGKYISANEKNRFLKTDAKSRKF